MTKFAQSTFSSRAASDDYRKQHDRMFQKCAQCGNTAYWPKPDCTAKEFHREAVAERLAEERRQADE